MNTFRIIMLAILAALYSQLSAQNVTYYHEPDIMNQFTVMEIGAGALQPDLYYKTFHKNYKNTAHATNKIAYRVENQVYTGKEVLQADSIDSCLVKRARVEALNIASRTASVSDLAWLAEKSKIENKFKIFDDNINNIVSYGGTSEDYKNWREIYDCLQCAVKLIRNSYLDVGSRKKEYLAIYQDIVRRNLSLIKQLLYWNSLKKAKEVRDSAVKPRPLSSKEVLANDARRRWHSAMAVDGFSPK